MDANVSSIVSTVKAEEADSSGTEKGEGKKSKLHYKGNQMLF